VIDVNEAVETYRVTDLKTAAGIQARNRGISHGHVRELVDVIRAWPEFVKSHPLVATKMPEGVLVLDGEHRLAAYRILKIPTCPVRLVGYDADAGPQEGWGYWESFRWNRAHGLPLTRADRKRATLHLIRTSQWSDRRIAAEVGLDHKTVGKLRKRGVGNFPTPEDQGLPRPGPSVIERAVKFFVKVEAAGEWKVLGLFGGDKGKLLVNTIRHLPRQQQGAAWRVLDAWADTVVETRRLRRAVDRSA
jgi:hypothetical protein